MVSGNSAACDIAWTDLSARETMRGRQLETHESSYSV